MIKAWSYSRLSDYQQCPRKAMFKYVMRLPEPPNKAMDRGTAIHSEGEAYLNWEMEEVPKMYFGFANSMQELRENNAIAEEQWAFRSDWTPCGWLDSEAWLRLKIDVAAVLDGKLHTIDFKTGQIRMSHQNQLELYALASMKRRPGFEQYVVENWYLDHNERTINIHYPVEEQRLQEKWENKVAPMLSDTQFLPTPNEYCKRCHFRKSNGGPCEL